jgi:sulfite dehydrogenase (quinone) subunit SoeC
MLPAHSIIFFTTASGAGYGLLFWLGLLRPLGLVPGGRNFGLTALGLALLLITAGLLSSMLHLGRAERAWRAVTQWRSSWLSREGLAAIATYVPAGLFGLGLVQDMPGLVAAMGLLAAAGAVATVYCTGMIYASLKPIRQWSHPLVVPGYLALSGFSGAVLLAMLGGFWGHGFAVPALLALLGGGAAFLLKSAYWRAIDTAAPVATAESATGLGRIGTVRPLDPPHTQSNYLLREMGYRIARKHQAKLRRIVLAAGFVLPMLLALLALLSGGPLAMAALALGTVLALGGLLVERWLMFAEATHTVTLYYTGR